MNWASVKSPGCNVAPHHYAFQDIEVTDQRERKGVIFYAIRDIKPFEELRWDYNDPVCRTHFKDVSIKRDFKY